MQGRMIPANVNIVTFIYNTYYYYVHTYRRISTIKWTLKSTHLVFPLCNESQSRRRWTKRQQLWNYSWIIIFFFFFYYVVLFLYPGTGVAATSGIPYKKCVDSGIYKNRETWWNDLESRLKRSREKRKFCGVSKMIFPIDSSWSSVWLGVSSYVWTKDQGQKTDEKENEVRSGKSEPKRERLPAALTYIYMQREREREERNMWVVCVRVCATLDIRFSIRYARLLDESYNTCSIGSLKWVDRDTFFSLLCLSCRVSFFRFFSLNLFFVVAFFFVSNRYTEKVSSIRKRRHAIRWKKILKFVTFLFNSPIVASPFFRSHGKVHEITKTVFEFGMRKGSSAEPRGSRERMSGTEQHVNSEWERKRVDNCISSLNPLNGGA